MFPPRNVLLSFAILLAGCVQETEQPPGSTRTLVVFSATWCGPCQRDKPTIAHVKQAGVDVIEYDVDRDQEVADSYSVTTVPLYIVVDSDNCVMYRGSSLSDAIKSVGLNDPPILRPKWQRL
jgi:thioredoxin 1